MIHWPTAGRTEPHERLADGTHRGSAAVERGVGEPHESIAQPGVLADVALEVLEARPRCAVSERHERAEPMRRRRDLADRPRRGKILSLIGVELERAHRLVLLGGLDPLGDEAQTAPPKPCQEIVHLVAAAGDRSRVDFHGAGESP